VSIRLPARWGERPALLALAILALLLFPGAIFSGRAFYVRDIHLQWHGQMESFVRSVAAGSWPVWDPWASFGQPLWANANNQILYPTTWLNLVLPAWTVFTIFVAVHAVLGAAGLYFWARDLGSSPAGALVAAALWMASGPLLSCVTLWNHYGGAAWMPWALLAADRTLARGRLAPALGWGTAMAAQILCGSPDTLLMTTLLVAARTISSLRKGGAERPTRRRQVGLAAVASVFALALSAAQWMPTLEVARGSARWSLPAGLREAWSVPPAGLVQTLVPVAWDDAALAPAQRLRLFGTREPLLLSLYLGLPAVALVAASAASQRRREAAFFATAGLAAAVVSLGSHTPVYALLTKVLPPLAMVRFPAKAMIVVALCWAVLAGIGFDGWREAGRTGGGEWRPWRVAVPMAGALVMALAVAGLLWRGAGQGATQGLVAGVAPSLVLGGVVLVLTWRAGPRTAALAAALCLADLVLASRGLNPTAPPDLFRARPPVLAAIHQEDGRRLYAYDYLAASDLAPRHLGRPDPYRMVLRADAPPWLEALGMRAYLLSPVAEVWGLFQSYDSDAMGLLPTAQVSLTDLLIRAEGTPLHLRLLQLGAVSEVVALHTDGLEALQTVATFPGLFPEPIRVLRVPEPLPRTYAVQGVRVADGPAALAALSDVAFDPTRAVILAAGTPALASPAFRGTSRTTELRPDRVIVEAEMSDAGHVVLVDAYGAGWRATVDGQPAPLLRANVAFRAVPVPAGRHTIELVCRPASVAWGLAVSMLALMAATIALRKFDRRG
jgi:Bacterial membrane protein YfhO